MFSFKSSFVRVSLTCRQDVPPSESLRIFEGGGGGTPCPVNNDVRTECPVIYEVQNQEGACGFLSNRGAIVQIGRSQRPKAIEAL